MDNDTEHTLVLDISDFAISKNALASATKNSDHLTGNTPEVPGELSIKLDEEGTSVLESTIDIQEGTPVLNMGSLSLPSDVKKNTKQRQRDEKIPDNKTVNEKETFKGKETLDESRGMSEKEENLEMDSEITDVATQSADEMQDDEIKTEELSQNEVEGTEDLDEDTDLDDEFDDEDDSDDSSEEDQEDDDDSAPSKVDDDEKQAISDSSDTDVDPDFAEKVANSVRADTVAPQAEVPTEVKAENIQKEAIDYKQPEVSPIKQPQPLPEDSRRHSPVSVGEMPVTLTFETGRNKITVGELEKIKEGYTFECGNPTEAPITIYANDLPIGIGELVDIEGRIGVRVIKFDNK